MNFVKQNLRRKICGRWDFGAVGNPSAMFENTQIEGAVFVFVVVFCELFA